MATYFHGNTEMQNGDVLQTLILMNQHHHLPPPSSAANFVFPSHEIHGMPLYNGATEVKQGLSLSLSSRKHAPGEEEVRVFGKAALSCKYLKAAQQLLDEIVNIRKEAKNGRESAKEDNRKNPEPSIGKPEAELTTSEKQEIQMKKAKFVNMLHEVN